MEGSKGIKKVMERKERCQRLVINHSTTETVNIYAEMLNVDTSEQLKESDTININCILKIDEE